MNQLKHILPAILLMLLLAPVTAQAQCDQAAQKCEVALVDYLTDGQYYRVQLVEGESATLKLTLFQGFRYRIAACTEAEGAKVLYEMFDGSGTKVYSNEDIDNGTGWDFEIGATDEFTIEAKLSGAELGCVVFNIGYDEEMFFDFEEFVEADDPFFEGEMEDSSNP
ncbi:MAG: hypothetical protein AAF998_24675 [Bacteroidota bacterium]